jgi:hypothetical protein
VIKQKNKPLEPTLRVATSFNSTERARNKDNQESWIKCIQKPMAREAEPLEVNLNF